MERTNPMDTQDETETAVKIPARWYMINNFGAATLCVDQADAEANARDADEQWPRHAPHVAVQLAPVRDIDAGSDNGSRPLDYTPGVLDRTAPPRIWLQIDTNGDNDDRDQPCPDPMDGNISWCWEKIGGLEIEYVRADLARSGSDNGWLPIDSAPEGVEVLAYWPPVSWVMSNKGMRATAVRTGSVWHNPEDQDDEYTEPQCWIPLPPAPQPKGGE